MLSFPEKTHNLSIWSILISVCPTALLLDSCFFISSAAAADVSGNYTVCLHKLYGPKGAFLKDGHAANWQLNGILELKDLMEIRSFLLKLPGVKVCCYLWFVASLATQLQGS